MTTHSRGDPPKRPRSLTRTRPVRQSSPFRKCYIEIRRNSVPHLSQTTDTAMTQFILRIKFFFIITPVRDCLSSSKPHFKRQSRFGIHVGFMSCNKVRTDNWWCWFGCPPERTLRSDGPTGESTQGGVEVVNSCFSVKTSTSKLAESILVQSLIKDDQNSCPRDRGKDLGRSRGTKRDGRVFVSYVRSCSYRCTNDGTESGSVQRRWTVDERSREVQSQS